MGGLISVIVCSIAAVLLMRTGHPVLFWFSVISAVVALWSWGVMHNHATENAKARHDLIVENMRAEGRSDDEIANFDNLIINPGGQDTDAIPNGIALINMLATGVGAVLLICGLVIRVS